MKTSGITLAAAVVTMLPHSVLALPGALKRSTLGGISRDVAKVIEESLDPETQKTWDIEQNPQMCKVYMETVDGGNCYAQVICDDGVKEYNAGKAGWNVCYLGGRQFFNDPRIGEFSITFTKTDYYEFQGLLYPILQLKNVGDWKSLDVTALGAEYEMDDLCEDYDGDCYEGPYICHYFGDLATGRKKEWECGVPKLGKGGAGLDSNGPTNERGYAPGECSIHVIHYQKPDPSKDSYSLELKLYDNNQAEIGGTGKVGPNRSLTSKLPYTVEVNTGAVDADPVRFAYAGFQWDSTSPNCKTGGYEDGDREMDCTFHCD